jgi:hypothetical protein
MNNDDKMMLGLFLVTGVMLWLAFFSAGAFGGTLPDPALTPGVTRDLTLDQICGTKWGKDARAVTAAMKAHVYAEYNMAPHQGDCALSPRGCEIDHAISRELAGADDVRNLWPQPYGGQCNAVDKDRLENKLHALVCAKVITIETAQQAIARNWIEAYRAYIGPITCAKESP